MARIVTPETNITIYNNSAAKDSSTIPEYTGPLYLIAAPALKGPEDMTLVYPSGDSNNLDANFIKVFGKPNFNKYGQESITAGVLLMKQARIIFKRIVADDATLANIVIYRNISSKEVQKTNEEGQPLYTDAVTLEPTVIAEGNAPIMEIVKVIKYTTKSFPNIKTMKELRSVVISTLDEDNGVYPIIALADIGRGKSDKRIQIVSDYTQTKRLKYMKFTLNVLENSEKLEYFTFTSNPNITEYSKNMSIKTVITQYSEQIHCELFETYDELSVADIIEGTKYEFDELYNMDLYNAKDRSGNPLEGIEVDFASEDAVNLAYTFGIKLENGSNGSFGSIPIESESYNKELVKFFSGETTSEIYDIDRFKIDIVPDACYSPEVKVAIAKWVNNRIDPFFISDMGKDASTYSDILSLGEVQLEELNTMYASINHLYGDIIDPYSKKQITVTCALELAEMCVDHFKYGRHRPFAGKKNDMIFKRFIPGTINFRPIQLPNEKQKDAFVDRRINYATMYREDLVQDLQVTADKDNTEASFINNIWALQHVVKDIRDFFPAERYSFLEEEELEEYKEQVENRVLINHKAKFKNIELIYLQDEAAKQEKKFMAALNIDFKDFDQHEEILIYLTNGNY